MNDHRGSSKRSAAVPLRRRPTPRTIAGATHRCSGRKLAWTSSQIVCACQEPPLSSSNLSNSPQATRVEQPDNAISSGSSEFTQKFAEMLLANQLNLPSTSSNLQEILQFNNKSHVSATKTLLGAVYTGLNAVCDIASHVWTNYVGKGINLFADPVQGSKTENDNKRPTISSCSLFKQVSSRPEQMRRLTEDLVSTTSFKNTTADEEAATAFKAGAPHNQTYELMSTTSHGQVQEVIDEFRPVRQIKHAAGPATAHSSEFKMCAPTKHSISLTHTSEDLRDIEKARVTTTINRRELDRTFIEGQNLTGLQELEAKVASTSSYPRCSIPFCKAALLGPGPFTNVICYKHALCNECLDLTIDYLRLYGKISCAIMGCEVIVTEHTVATRPDLLSLVRRSRRPLQRNLNSKINPVRTDSALSAATLAEKRLQDLRRVRRYPNNKRLWSRMIYRTCDMCQRDSIWVEICILENCVHVICSICYYNRYTRRQPLARCPATYCTMAVLSQDGIEDSNKTNSYHSAFVNGSQTYPNGSALTAGFSTRTKTYRTADSDLPPKSCDLCKRLFASTLSEAFVVSRCYHGFCDYCASYKIYRLNSNVCPFPACRTKLSYDDFGRFCTFIERIHFEFARRTKGVER